ncbi:hypothetical protein LV83_03317 [Algoriphagus yeomjeoni]|uniref:Uncharacterized protein n=1 Tax=Algoriphagus yeomjeoni TaxID=291403 RepID=A0A327P3E1_9BACT|nr:hypothetical protein LV83_03317 [Algoriphagus yeomjeoni]
MLEKIKKSKATMPPLRTNCLDLFPNRPDYSSGKVGLVVLSRIFSNSTPSRSGNSGRKEQSYFSRNRTPVWINKLLLEKQLNDIFHNYSFNLIVFPQQVH